MDYFRLTLITMKRLLLAISLTLSLSVEAQITNRLIVTQNFEQGINAPNLLFTIPPNDNRIFVASRDSLKLNFYQIRGLSDSIMNKGARWFKPIGYVPDWSEITGKPNMSNYYLASNPNGYISSYTESDPIWVAAASQYRTKIQNDALYQPIGTYLTSESDPVWNAVSGAYRTKTQNDLLYKAIGYVPSWADVTSKPSFATVATSGSYNDLINKPTIPAAQVNSDWNAVSGLAQILNKPTIPTVPGLIVNSATIGLSKATLNSTYPNVAVGYMVLCPSIILGGAVYIKATENGSSDVWQTISAPPTL